MIDFAKKSKDFHFCAESRALESGLAVADTLRAA